MRNGTTIGVCDKCWNKHCDEKTKWNIEDHVRTDERSDNDFRCWIKRCRQPRILGYVLGAYKKHEKKEEVKKDD